MPSVVIDHVVGVRLESTRYCYYTLPENFDSETGVGMEGTDAIAHPVPTVIALADDWIRCIKGAEFGSEYGSF